jgi:aspartyl-tRNA(Asn)/glutamyl-tRNA(Gln) amidotransferase subunit A
MTIDIVALPLSTARHLIESGDLDADELIGACRRQIERLNPTLNAFITVCRDIVTSSGEGSPEVPAGEKGAAAKQSPLSGIPLAIKDLYDLAGYPTTAGTSFFKDEVAEADAVVVQKMRAAGAVIVGKTNTHEIAHGVTGVNPHFGACRNPWDTSRIPGGSSSGSAVAVTAGMCLGALGTDTGGSIRIPAALCGIVGLKPTFGRVSLRSVFPLSWNLDHAGPLVRSVRDAGRLLQLIAGYDPLDPGSVDMPVEDYLKDLDGGVKGWRAAVAAGDYFEGLDPEVATAFRRAVEVFEELGAIVTALDLSLLREASLANAIIIGADAAAFHRERLAGHPEGFGADVRQRLEIGAKRTGPEYALARRTQTEMIRRMKIFFTDYDILLTPTVPIPAPLIEGADALEHAQRLTRFTAPFNLTGLPALSVPCGFTAANLPIGLQIISGRWAEAKVLRAGRSYEAATEWHEQYPPIATI